MKYKLKEIFDLQMGKTPARNNDKYWNTKDYKWISIADLTSTDKYINNTKEYISQSAVTESGIKIIPANTVVMSFKLSIGKTAILSEDMYSNEAIMAFHDKHVVELLPEYIYYLIKAKNWNGGSNRAVMGQTLNKATLSEIEVDVHTIDEQRKIVESLNIVGRIICKRNTQLSKLGDILRARFVEMFGDIIINDRLWKNDNWSNVVKIVNGKNQKSVESNNGKYVICGSGGIMGRATDYLTEENSVIIGRKGNINKPILMREKYWNVDTAFGVEPNENYICVEYLYMFCLFFDFNRLNKAVTIPSLTKMDLLNISMPIPDLHTQKRFAAFVSQVDKSKVEVQRALDEAQLLFDSLMQKYFG